MKLRDLLELCRMSNLPTVWSNVVAGFAIGLATSTVSASDGSYLDELFKNFTSSKWWLDGLLLASQLIGISLIYCGGMVLNDFWDRSVDAKERPTRPIPSGRVKPWQAAAAAICLLLSGFILCGGWAAPETIGTAKGWDQFGPHLIGLTCLTLLVVLYNLIHQASAAGVVVMGLCRALAFITPALLFAHSPCDTALNGIWILAPAAALLIYTVFISIVARNEMKPNWFGGPKTVMNMIAAMPLLDAMWLIVMGLWPASLFCVACAGMTKLAHRKVAGS